MQMKKRAHGAKVRRIYQPTWHTCREVCLFLFARPENKVVNKDFGLLSA